MSIYVCDLFLIPVGDGKEHHCYPLIGVLRVCAGNDRLDELFVGGVHSQLRGVLRGGTGLHPVAHHCRVVLAGPASQRHGHRRTRQLDGKLRRRHRLPQYEGNFSS